MQEILKWEEDETAFLHSFCTLASTNAFTPLPSLLLLPL
jgi:hypothetical protein